MIQCVTCACCSCCCVSILSLVQTLQSLFSLYFDVAHQIFSRTSLIFQLFASWNVVIIHLLRSPQCVAAYGKCNDINLSLLMSQLSPMIAYGRRVVAWSLWSIGTPWSWIWYIILMYSHPLLSWFASSKYHFEVHILRVL